MMSLPDKAKAELQVIYQKEFSIKLTEDAAKTEARRLLLFFYQFLLFEQTQIQKSDFSPVPSSQSK